MHWPYFCNNETLHTNKEEVLIIVKSHCTWCIIDHLIGQWAYELLMSFWNTVNVQLNLFIPESRKVMKSRERWQTLPFPTRPMHFGSRGSEPSAKCIDREGLRKRRTGTKQGKLCILNGPRDCAIITRRKGWIKPYIEQYFVVSLLTKAS